MSNQRIVLDQDVVVTHLQGKMYLVAADGSQRLVAEGDVLPKDAVLLAPEGASFQGGETTFTLGSGERPEQGDAVLANAGGGGRSPGRRQCGGRGWCQRQRRFRHYRSYR